MINLAVMVVTAIAFLKWIYRANLNSRGFGARDMAFTPGWAIGCYFVPFLNLVRPYQAMKVSGNPVNWKSQPVSPVLGCWWALWLGAGFLGQVSFRMSASAKTIEAFRAATNFAIVADLVDVILRLCAWALISGIAARQTNLVDRGGMIGGDSMRSEDDSSNPVDFTS